MSVKTILEGLGAPAEAVSWAADYGDDMKRAWAECEHPELLLPMAAGVGVPNFDVLNAAVEVVRMNLDGIVIHPAVDKGFQTIERFICDEATDDEVLSVMSVMSQLTHDFDGASDSQLSSFGAVGTACEAALMASQGCLDGMMGKLSVCVMLSAQAKAEAVAPNGTDDVRGKVISVVLKRTAPLVRRYIPYESFVGGFVASMRAGKDGEDEYVPEA